MTPRVLQLPKDVAERIAAGEVIERPASIVKELVENALDAGATRIWVEVRDGGQKLIRVTDNGCGMAREDALLALSRFATSKIRTWDDMEALRTLGFRGEALPSVVAVSRTEILTREPEAPVGTRVVARGGEDPQVEEAGCPEGTTITVTDLFFNTPARRKFLKSGSAEAARIIELLGKLALARIDVHFRLTTRAQDDDPGGGRGAASAGREVFNFPLQYGLAERMRRLWNLEARTPLLPVEARGNGIELAGLVAPPPTFAAARTRQVFFVNGRLIAQSALNVALAQGFEPLVPDRRFPLGVIFLEVDPDRVDVNIHPTKAEVRFLHPGDAFRVVRDGVAEALRAHHAVPQDAAEAVRRVSRPPAADPFTRRVRIEDPPPRVTPAAVEAAMQATLPLPTTEHYAIPAPVARVAAPRGASPWQVLAQVDRTYIVCLRGDDLWIVDQHTAHERIHYEALARLSESGAASQALLFPLMLELAPDEAAGLEACLPVFETLGYSIEPFGGNTFVVRALPSGIDRLARVDTLREIVADVLADGRPREVARLRELLRATTACRASVMAGDVLTREEMEGLLMRLDVTDRAGYCPHGRPVSVRLGTDELARLFGRK